MKIELTCRESDGYIREVKVYALYFDANGKTFSMRYCLGDDWAQTLQCPVPTAPLSFQFQWDRVAVRFETKKEAEEFGDWLIEADAKVQHGFNTMRD